MSLEDNITEKLKELPERSNKIYQLLLSANKPLKTREISDLLDINDRATRRELKTLIDYKLIKAIPTFEDLRVICYAVNQ